MHVSTVCTIRSIARTWVYRLALYSRCPAPAEIPAGDLQELSGELDVIGGILDDLHTALPRVILCPRVSFQPVTLVTRMAHLCKVMVNERNASGRCNAHFE